MTDGDAVTIGDLQRLEKNLRELMNEHDRRYEQRFADGTKAVEAALNAAEKAVVKAENASEKRFEGVNEFRGQLADQAQTFYRKSEAEQRIATTEQKLREVEKRVNDIAAASRGGREMWVLIAGVVTFLFGVGAFLLKALP